MGKRYLPIDIEEQAKVMFYAVATLSPDGKQVAMAQHLSTKDQTTPAWRANLLRSLADTIELEALLDEGDE